MTDKKNVPQKPTEEERASWPINHVAKVFKKFNAYDRDRDRKNKRLYDYEEDIVKEESIDATE
jgi:hypothetical protein